MSSKIRYVAITLLCFFSFHTIGCHRATVPQEFLDSETAVTVRRIPHPLEFYRNRSSAGAHARDLINLAPVEVNRQGKRELYLWLSFWSTLDSQSHFDPTEHDTIHVLVDSEPMELPLVSPDHQTIGISSRIYDLPVGSAADAYYAITRPQLRRMSTSKSLSLVIGTEKRYKYELWGSAGRVTSELAEFVNNLPEVSQ